MSDTDKHDGGPVFPQNYYDSPRAKEHRYIGISALDYFAGEAMQGMLSDPETITRLNACAKEVSTTPEMVVAKMAYELAKAMLEERNRISGAEAGAKEPEKTE